MIQICFFEFFYSLYKALIRPLGPAVLRLVLRLSRLNIGAFM